MSLYGGAYRGLASALYGDVRREAIGEDIGRRAGPPNGLGMWFGQINLADRNAESVALICPPKESPTQMRAQVSRDMRGADFGRVTPPSCSLSRILVSRPSPASMRHHLPLDLAFVENGAVSRSLVGSWCSRTRSWRKVRLSVHRGHPRWSRPGELLSSLEGSNAD